MLQMSAFDGETNSRLMHSSVTDAIEGLCYNQCIIGLRQWLGVKENHAQIPFSTLMDSLSQLCQDFTPFSFDVKKLVPARYTFETSLPSPLHFLSYLATVPQDKFEHVCIISADALKELQSVSLSETQKLNYHTFIGQFGVSIPQQVEENAGFGFPCLIDKVKQITCRII